MSQELIALKALDLNEVQQNVQGYEKALEQMKADYLPLLNTPITDKKQLEVVKAARMNFKNTRLEGVSRLDAGCKALYSNWKLWVKARDTFEKKFSDEEEKFRANEKAFEDAEELKALEEAKKWAERMNLRKQAAFDIGYYFNGAHYLLDRENGEPPWVLNEDQLAGMAMSDEALYALLETQADELKTTREIKAEAEAKAQEEREAQAAAAKAEADRLAAAQAEIERREKEMAEKERQMNAKVNEVRKNELIAAGMILRSPSELVVYMDGPTHDVNALYTVDGWDEVVANLRDLCIKRDANEAERKRVLEEQRLAREKQLQEEAAAEAVPQERLRVAAEQERQEKAQELLAQQEREKALQASDREKVEGLAVKVAHVLGEMPSLKSAIGQSAMKSYDKQLREIHASMVKLSQEL